ncbi:MAG: hypothetical protein IJT75_00160 [Bacteroidaceae bacterium]|nr:hypothetical protein [Bacteroidaceae bacterium]
MNRLYYLFFILTVLIVAGTVLSCSGSEDEVDIPKYGTLVSVENSHFRFDQDSCPFLQEQVPTFSEEELKSMLIGYKWVEVRDSAYKIQEDGTCVPMRDWKWVLPINSPSSYYEPLFHYTYKDLFATDSCLYFFSGHYDWKERLEKDVFFQVRLDYVKCRFEKTGYHWVAESQGKQFSMLRIVYIDGQKMIAIRWFDVPISITSSKALPYCLTFYRNEGSSEFLDSLIAYRNSHHY